MEQVRTQGFECGVADYKASRCQVLVNPQGALVWCREGEVTIPEQEREQWGRDYHEGWQLASLGDKLPTGTDEEERITLIPE